MRRPLVVTVAVGGLLVASFVAVKAPSGPGNEADSLWTDAAGAGHTVSLTEWSDSGPETGAAVRSQAAKLYTSFTGTLQQRDALDVLRLYYGNRFMDQCMAHAGHPEWDWSLTRTNADPADPLLTNLWLAEPMSRWRSHDLVAARPFLLGEKTMNGPETPDFSHAVSECLNRHHPRQPHRLYGGVSGRTIDRLQEDWWSFTREFEASAMPGEREYESCMRGAHITMLQGEHAGGEGFETLVGYAMSGHSPPDHDIPADPANHAEWSDPAWQKFLRLEDEFDVADWNCRGEIYAEHIDDLTPAMNAWATQHAADIDQASRYWKAVTDEAHALGYDGQSGSLEGVVGTS